jgi:hypothetical protein
LNQKAFKLKDELTNIRNQAHRNGNSIDLHLNQLQVVSVENVDERIVNGSVWIHLGCLMGDKHHLKRQ